MRLLRTTPAPRSSTWRPYRKAKQLLADDAVWPYSFPAGRLPQLGGERPPVPVVVVGEIDLARRRVSEPPIDHASSGAGVVGLVAEQRDREWGLDEGLAEVAHHLGRGVLQPVEHTHQRGGDVVGARGASRSEVAGEGEKVVSFGQ